MLFPCMHTRGKADEQESNDSGSDKYVGISIGKYVGEQWL